MITLVQADNVVPLSFSFENRSHPIINFYTSDITYTHSKLKENGVEVSEINDYGALKGMDFVDLNGHLLGVCCF